MGYLDRLMAKWKLGSIWQVVVVLIIFAATGTTVMLLKKPVVAYFAGDGGNIWFSVVYYILIFPIYNAFLLFYGFIFGQFNFFWEFEKKTWQRLRGKRKVEASSNHDQSASVNSLKP